MKSKVVRVAAIQMRSANGAVEANLRRATQMVEKAHAAGAKLILLPELFSGGYWLCEKAWECAEPQGGTTEQWLRETSARLSVYLGGSYLLAEGEDFFNMFALASPDGTIAGRVPKQQPASLEAYLFRGRESSHIIETALGRVGIGICYDNAFRFIAEALIAGDADILLSPYCAPTPQQSWYYPRGRVEAFIASYRHGAKQYARLLGIPAVMVNKSGPWASECPSFFPAQNSKFHGQSEIADSSGEILAELADEEAIIVEDVTMDPSRKARKLPQEIARYGRWIGPVPWDFKMFWIVEALGQRSYRRNTRRQEMAKAISGLKRDQLKGASDHY
jgi:N-carbamoylputrescine amidase